MRREDRIIYLDNGATSFPKPAQVPAAMEHFTKTVGGSPGRSGHRLSQEAARVVFNCREALADLFHIPDSRRIIFTLNATEALNLALLGLLRPGERVVTTSMEHNSVMRPLRHLVRSRGITLDIVPCDDEGRLDLNRLEEALRPRPRLLVAVHGSNVTGTRLPVREVGAMTAAAETLLLLDAAQTAGAVPIDVETDRIDMLAFTGHKGLLGPQGTGGLWIREGLDVEPVFRGGTGSNSELEEQPEFFPDRLEGGTQNAVGIAGLFAGIEFIRNTGLEALGEREKALTSQLLEGLQGIANLKTYGPGVGEERTPIVSLNIEGAAPSEVGFLLDEAFGVLTRVGLHCAPGAHRTIGTYPTGTVRLSPGYFTTPEEIERTLEALDYIAGKRG